MMLRGSNSISMKDFGRVMKRTFESILSNTLKAEMRKLHILTLFCLLPGLPLSAQITGNNLMEYQLGNLPYTDPPALSSHYDQLNLAYRYKGLAASVRYEQFFSQHEESSYFGISQFQVQYRKDKLDLKIGNFTETLGNGLLVRGYEIAGSVFEEESYRSRYGFYRDLLGFSVKYSGDIWYFHAIRGKSLVNTLPPTLSSADRRIDLVEGMQTGITLYGQTLGAILMRNTQPVDSELFYSMLFSGSVFGLLTYSFEYAHDITKDLPLFATDDMNRYGIYGSAGINFGRFGLSFEYKNYHRLQIGSGINDPPTAVREQKYKVLNRSIHVPILDDESGIQLEAYYTFGNYERLIVNYTRARNQFFMEYVFDEAFMEFTFYPASSNDLTLFADFASDAFKSEDRRYAAGTVWDHSFSTRWSSQFHAEYQYVHREVSEPTPFHNLVLIAGISRSPLFSASVVWEVSSDPYLTDRPDTPAVESGFRYWPGLEASYKLNQAVTISVFAGKRRGGPACTSGICYEVLDFEGIEVRLKTKF